MTISVVHHPNADSDLIISEPSGGRVVIKLSPAQANLVHDEFALVLGLLRDLVEDLSTMITQPHSLALAQAYLNETGNEE